MGALRDRYESELRAGAPLASWNLRPVTEDEMIAAIETGSVVNAGGRPDAHEEIPSDEDISGRYPDDPPDVTAVLDAALLRKVLLRYAGKTRGDVEFDPRGLRLEQILIVGDLNWAWMQIPFAVGFWGCAFHRFFMDVDHASVPRLVFEGCFFGEPVFLSSSFNASESSFASDLRFLGCEGLRQLFLLDCDLATFELRDHPGGAPDEKFRLVLRGSTIGKFIVQGDDAPAEMIPAKDGLDRLSVQRVSLWRWEDDDEGWQPKWLGEWLAGGAVPHPMTPAKKRRTALNPHRPQVWAQFAAALERDSENDQATALRIRAERHRDAKRPWIVRAFRWLTLDLTVRYFHRNVRAVGWLAVLWLAAAALAWGNIHTLYGSGAGKVPSGSFGGGVDGFLWALSYGLNFVISPLDLGFEAVWPSTPALAAWFALLKLLAITMFGLFIVGVSGVVQRSRSSNA